MIQIFLNPIYLTFICEPKYTLMGSKNERVNSKSFLRIIESLIVIASLELLEITMELSLSVLLIDGGFFEIRNFL